MARVKGAFGADVTVRGAGVLGLAAAFALARRGARVRVVDPAGMGAGASGGVVGALAPHAPDRWDGVKAFQLQSLVMAEAFWADVREVGGQDPGFARTGRLQPLADAAAVDKARALEKGAADHWGGAFGWRVLPASGADWEPVSPSGLIVHDSLTARLSPRRALSALGAALQALGAQIVTETSDAPPDALPDEGLVLHASGVAGLADLGAALGRTIGQGVKGQAALLAFDAPDLPQIYAPGLHIVPHIGGQIAIGSTSENTWDAPTSTDEQLDAVIARARDVMPVLRDAPVILRWAALRPRAASRQAVLGPIPGRAGHFVLNGGFKTGFGLAPLLATRAADLLLTGAADLPEALRLESLLARG